MPDLPWTARSEMESGQRYLVLASYLGLRRVTSTLLFVRAVRAVRRQLADAEGLIGYTLRAKPLAGDYWTLSVWTDRSALDAYVRAPPHVRVMSSLKPVMASTRFADWEITSADGQPNWAGALERLAAT